MKKLLMALTFLLTMTTVRATTYNCTANETIIIPDCVCTPPECPECPILPNETIIIQNLTIPLNTSCQFDTVGFDNVMDECNKEKDDWITKFTSCDNQLTTEKLCNVSLAERTNDLNACRTDVTKKEGEKNTYFIYGVIACAIGAFVWYQQKVKPPGGLRTERQ